MVVLPQALHVPVGKISDAAGVHVVLQIRQFHAAGNGIDAGAFDERLIRLAFPEP